ncbi:MAG: creatinine amidohydrolase [Gammaproteobacteria bacterium]
MLLLIGMPLLCGPAVAQTSRVFLEELTSTELAAAVRTGSTTVIVPVGGTEQSGPHLSLGKHNVRVRRLAARVAEELGNTLVAPVIAYVPEGNIDPPSGHMRFAGTISVPVPVFKAVLEAAARSLRQHGFRDVVLIGDHGGYQRALGEVTAKLNGQWAKSAARVHFISAYYRATHTTYVDALKSKGLTDAQIGSHAGTADTSLQLALAPSTVRPERFDRAREAGRGGGTSGDPRPSSAALGQLGVDAIIRQTVAAIRVALSSTGR